MYNLLPPESWRLRLVQMLQIIFSHAFPDSEETLPTLQMLMNANSTMRPEIEQSYTQACSRFLEILSSVMGPTDWNTAIRIICVGLTEVLWPLTIVEDVSTSLLTPS